MPEPAVVSPESLRQYAREARAEYGDHKQVVGKCDYICHDLADTLSVHGLPRDSISIEERRIGEDGQENHYICRVDAAYVEGASGDVWVDVSLDQFCDANVEAGEVAVSLGPHSSIERVRVMFPGDSRREVYMSVATYLENTLSDVS